MSPWPAASSHFSFRGCAGDTAYDHTDPWFSPLSSALQVSSFLLHLLSFLGHCLLL